MGKYVNVEDKKWYSWAVNTVGILTFFNAMFWLALIFYTRYNAPYAGFTFMFQFLHFTSYIVNAGGLNVPIRIGVTILFLMIDTSALLWRIIDPVLEPWSAFHILATLNSAFFLGLGLAQAFVYWMPYALKIYANYKNKRSVLI